MIRDVSSNEALLSALKEAQELRDTASYTQDWAAKLTTFLNAVAKRSPQALIEKDFLQYLWDEQAVSSTGNGSVKIGPALENSDFRNWFAEQIRHAPNESGPLDAYLKNLYGQLVSRMEVLCGRVPRLKINRVLCALFPESFTTIADIGRLQKLHGAMGGPNGAHPVQMHAFIRSRIDEVLGPAPADGKVARLSLPWYLYDALSAGVEPSPQATSTPIDSTLTPLIAIKRRKGLTAMKGSFASLMNYVQILEDGLTREEFADAIRRENPDLAADSIPSVINSVAREFGLCAIENGVYRLTARGINLLSSSDPDELADHLLTRVLGIDNLIDLLRTGTKTKPEIIQHLKKVNPGWTADYGPSSIIGWLASMEVIEYLPQRHVQLTPRGERWAEMITWSPSCLPAVHTEIIAVLEPATSCVDVGSFSQLKTRLDELILGKLTYTDEVVRQLHAGLWAHPVRHFAVLCGISGSGKTQLALQYSLALCGAKKNDHDNVRVIPVQPGWFDPSPLLGHVNPLTQAYRSAPFLDLLLRAAEDPAQPYVVILDEMNLSHPEQYLAPILSAMETRGWIDLHQLPEGASTIPQRIQYPSNIALIGTLNMDETTHGLSDKVLDRAYTLEFWQVEVSNSPVWNSTALDPATKEKAKRVLSGLSDVLAPVRLHFAWRTIDDVLRYIEFIAKIGPDTEAALDAAICAKILPKLRGEHSSRFETALMHAFKLLDQEGLTRSSARVTSLLLDLRETGTARFWR